MLDFLFYKINSDGKLIADGKEVESVEFVYFAQTLSRVMFGDINKNEGVFCASKDGNFPDRGERRLDGPCADCHESKWQKDAQGNWIAPNCAEQFNLKCFDVERKQLFSFTVKRASIKPFKKYLSKIVLQFDAAQPGIDLKLCVIGKLTVTREKKGNQSYYLPVFDISRNATPKEAQYFMQIQSMIGGGHPPQQQMLPHQQQNMLPPQHQNYSQAPQQPYNYSQAPQQPYNYNQAPPQQNMQQMHQNMQTPHQGMQKQMPPQNNPQLGQDAFGNWSEPPHDEPPF